MCVIRPVSNLQDTNNSPERAEPKLQTVAPGTPVQLASAPPQTPTPPQNNSLSKVESKRTMKRFSKEEDELILKVCAPSRNLCKREYKPTGNTSGKKF
jgi:hypothetical protein